MRCKIPTYAKRNHIMMCNLEENNLAWQFLDNSS
jgi:hypothetical protein